MREGRDRIVEEHHAVARNEQSRSAARRRAPSGRRRRSRRRPALRRARAAAAISASDRSMPVTSRVGARIGEGKAGRAGAAADVEDRRAGASSGSSARAARRWTGASVRSVRRHSSAQASPTRPCHSNTSVMAPPCRRMAEDWNLPAAHGLRAERRPFPPERGGYAMSASQTIPMPGKTRVRAADRRPDGVERAGDRRHAARPARDRRGARRRRATIAASW